MAPCPPVDISQRSAAHVVVLGGHLRARSDRRNWGRLPGRPGFGHRPGDVRAGPQFRRLRRAGDRGRSRCRTLGRAPDDEHDGGEPPGGGGGLAEFEGTAVQVLNASSDDGAAASLASRLEDEGFRIQVVEPAARIYQRTTVFWTPNDGRAAAEALADRFGWRAGPKPSTLTDSIPVHVVVGEDVAS